ncbi:leucine-rich repeat-containing protein 27-like isoform X1 [Stylophora pistillata]|uniref:leucine-rich repeat-containing protein 27-like isoform X1 n=1 Tax=Stylophora pistillata TaxID=50429 RepID=UPI000C03E142|nr:leucine-rich repeat-containing protein 27-like isoform X1 [Stylophora pistillata]
MAVGDGGVDEVVEQLINTASALGSTTIDLSKKRLTQFPAEVLNLHQLEFLYLEGNAISSLPEELFDCLPNLRWLDLRNNRITDIPPIIGKHRNLRNLLLEGNTIESLPLELGLVKSLSGLNISSNPLEFPPSFIVEKGTQEVLKFLREQYLLQLQERGAVLVEEHPESSSSEELMFASTQDNEITGERERVDQVENERNIKADRAFKLPPIIQAAAARPKNRSVDESEGNLLRGQKARKFEQEKSTRIFEQKSPVRTMKHEATSPRKVVSFYGSGMKDGKVQLEPLEGKRRKGEQSDKHLETSNRSLELDKNLYIVDSHHNGRRDKSEKLKRRRRPKPENPQKSLPVVGSFESHSDVVVSTSGPDLSKVKETASVELQKEIPIVDEKTHNETKKTKNLEYSGAHGFDSKGSKPLSVFEGDMVAVRVPEKLYIKGQPCLGKVTSSVDHQGLFTIHYFTGSYGGRWRPMMSRTSPYLRKVTADNILCKFKLTTDGRMSPITQKKLRTVVDDQRNENNDPK